MIDIAFDIETIPDPDMPEELRLSLFEGIDNSEIKAPSNYKDPDKIEAYIEEAKLKREQKKEELLRSAALSPMTGRIACIGLYGQSGFDHGTHVVLRNSTEASGTAFNHLDEKELLESFWNAAKTLQQPRWVSFNGKSFDLHFIRVRSMKYGIKPTTFIDGRKYYSDRHLDLREVLGNFDSRAKGTLDDWLLFFGLQGKIAEGKMVGQWWDEGNYDKISEYCLDDCKKTYELAQKVGPFF